MPAVVRCRALDAHGRTILGWSTLVDFRETIPSASEFDRIWAAGTTQNHVREPGRFRLIVASGEEFRALSPGRYVVEVVLADTRGNATRTRFPLSLSGS